MAMEIGMIPAPGSTLLIGQGWNQSGALSGGDHSAPRNLSACPEPFHKLRHLHPELHSIAHEACVLG